MEFNKAIDGLPQIVKILLAIFVDIVFIIYRIIYDVVNSKTVPLILDILCFFGLAIVTWIMDIIDTITANKIFLWEDWIK
ncbi:MAG: hypothetical protein LKJ88_07830 [Bacilli bacterium]|nr:hypothetical protein [Bacilli bacterium]